MLRRALLAFELLLVIAVGAAGCKQGIDERCEQNSDCESGICSTNSPGIGGICRGPNEPTPTDDGGTPDAMPDAAEGDAAPDADDDAAVPPDAADEAGALPDADDGEAGEAGASPDASDDGPVTDALAHG